MADRGSPGKASSTEEEYFVREDAEKKRKIALEEKKKKKAKELDELKKLHFMRCPKCGLELQEVEFKGLDVDVCFSCHGIFLDQGELETLVKKEKHGVVSAILNWFSPGAKK